MKKKSNKIIAISFVIFSILAFVIVRINIESNNTMPSYSLKDNVHPRLFMVNDDLNKVKKNLEAIQNVKNELLTNAKNPNLSMEIVANDTIDTKKFTALRKYYEANALLYLLNIDPNTGKSTSEKKSELARTAIDSALKTLSSLNNIKDLSDYEYSQYCGDAIFGAALVYDWCYDQLTQEEKKQFVSIVPSIASKMEMGYPPNSKKDTGYITGHSTGEIYLKSLLAFGISSYNEEPKMYNTIYDLVCKNIIPSRDFWYSSGLLHEGDSYETQEAKDTMIAMLMLNKLDSKNVVKKDIVSLFYRWIYTRRPDGQFLRDGDSFICDQYNFGEYWKYPFPLMLVTSYFNDPYLNKEYKNQYSENVLNEPVLEVMFYNMNKNNTKSFSSLPLTKYFNSPSGAMVARTGWEDTLNLSSSNVLVDMKIKEYQFNGHQHLDAGHFQVYYKGPLLIDSGIYNSSDGGYGSQHDINYHKRTIAHNSLLVYDPNEKFDIFGANAQNDGGQRWPQNGALPKTISDLKNNGYKVSSVTSTYIGPDLKEPDFSYIEGNLAKAYTSKVKSYTRSFVFLNLKDKSHPAALIVYDKVESQDDSFKKYWLLHMVNEPNINGNTTTIVNNNPIGGSSNFNYNGKVTNTTLTPEINNLNIEKIGGAGKEFYVFGKNYPAMPSYKDTSVEAGSWRIQISPKNPSGINRFLNVIQIQDYKSKNGTTTQPLEIEKIDTEKVEGTKVTDKIVLFSKGTSEILLNNLNFNIKQDTKYSTYKYLILNLSKGNWNITNNNGLNKNIDVSSSGALYFEGNYGEYSLRKN